jgi:hypothetical protein
LLCESNEWFNGVEDVYSWLCVVNGYWTMRVCDIVMYIGFDNLRMFILEETLLEFQ